MLSRRMRLITGFLLAFLANNGKLRDLGTGPWPMMPQDAAFGVKVPRFEKKLAEDDIILFPSNIKE